MFTLEEARRVSIGILFFNLEARLGGCQGHVAATLPPGKRPGTLCIGSWMGLRSGLEWCGKSRHHRDSNQDRPVRCRYSL